MSTLRQYFSLGGVLHPTCTYRVAGRVVLKPNGMGLYVLSLLLVDALAPYPSSHLVLATSRVPILGFDRARRHLPETLRERAIGSTWHSSFDRQLWDANSRYQQINRYVQRSTTTPTASRPMRVTGSC